MNMSKRSTQIAFIFLALVSFCLSSALLSQEHDGIVETVQVENIQLPVRVFDGKTLIGGLTKEDFELLVNGKKTEINGFFETRKKLEDRDAVSNSTSDPLAATIQPRLFVLVFNLSSFEQDFKDQMDLLFEHIIGPKDRIIVITNRYFLPEWVVTDTQATKMKILDVLGKEIAQLKLDSTGFEMDLKSIATVLKSRLADDFEAMNPSSIFEEFFLNYQFILEDIKEKFLRIPAEQYIKISEYLKSQPEDKWVLNFYQLGRLPMLDSFGEINQLITKYIDAANYASDISTRGGDREDPKEIKLLLQKLYQDFMMEFRIIDNLLIADIGKVFLNSGAVVHTQLLNPKLRYFSDDFKNESVVTETESVLKELTRLTGGSVVTSNLTQKFIEKITQKEDIVYVLSYVPDQKKKNSQKLNIKVKNKNYKVVFDNRKRLKSFNDMIAKLSDNEKDIEIETLAYDNNKISVKLKNVKMVRYEGEKFGAIQAHIKISDNKSHLVSSFDKVFKGINEQGVFQVELPHISSGKYNVVLEVKDLFALKSVYVGDAISISK